MSERVNPFRRLLPFQYFYATLGLVAANLLVFLLNQLVPVSFQILALNPGAVVEDGEWWQIFTYMYVHGDFSHILFNMVGLFFFGTAVEERMGSWEFLLFYHLVGALAGLASLGIYLVTGQYQILLLGASGAVFAVLLAFAVFRPNARILVFFVIPLKATHLVIIYTAFELFSQFLNPYSGVAHLTHLAGFFFAFFYLWIRFGLNAWTVFFSRDRYSS